jgi:peptide chain release factor subunit 1
MQVSAPDTAAVRRLSEISLDRPRILSLYLDLRPSAFATAAARASAVRSLIDRAERQLHRKDGLSHDDRKDLERSLERVRRELEGAVLSVKGAHGLAMFSSESAGLFEVIKLPEPPDSQVVIDRTPFIQPLVGIGSDGAWCVALVNRSAARVFRGSHDRLVEVEGFDDAVSGWHDQGGWSQARYQRAIAKEVADHLKRAAGALFRHYERRPFDHLLLGGPEELVPDFQATLHRYVAERVVGRIDVDVENSTPEQVHAAALPAMEEFERRREREALDRLAERTGSSGRAAAGLEAVLRALGEQRVETLLLADGYSTPGTVCPQCGWLGPEGVERCPADGSTLERRDDVIESAVERALQQSAEVLRVRRYDDLAAHGGIGAILRF